MSRRTPRNLDEYTGIPSAVAFLRRMADELDEQGKATPDILVLTDVNLRFWPGLPAEHVKLSALRGDR